MKMEPPGARVLDLGCGIGVPATRVLATRFKVTGVYLSGVQVTPARDMVPEATFLHQGTSEARFGPSSFLAVASLYVIIHVPLKEQRPLFRRVYLWLKPGWLFLALLGASRSTGTEKGGLGSDMETYWTRTDLATYPRWLTVDGFQMISHKFIPEGVTGHELFLVAELHHLAGGRVRIPEIPRQLSAQPRGKPKFTTPRSVPSRR